MTAPRLARASHVSLAELELDLDVFSGPFDLLLTLVLREEVDLLELQLAEVVLAYLDHLEQRGELDLETATEFIVLIAALLELKSRLMLIGEEEELLDIEPEQAAEELLARMLDARRYRRPRPTSASCSPPRRVCDFARRRCRDTCAAASFRRADGSQDPAVLGEAIRTTAADAARDQRAPHRRAPRSRSPSAWPTCAACCAAGPSASTRPSGAPTG